ncbi:MAG TPA: DUF4385 family protein [Polyangia bacterium]
MTTKRAPSPKQLEKAVLELLNDRGTATACPSEVARALDPKGWRPLMAPVRAAAARLQERGAVDVYQHGRPVRLEEARGPIRLRAAGVKDVNHRDEPHRYRIGRGEEGVLTVEPYKGELLPLWRFATPKQAKVSASAIWKKFLEYGRADDFVGMDMARKYLQMGYTRSRRYANHRGGKKYAPGSRTVLPQVVDAEKAESAEIFRVYWQRALKNRRYLVLRRRHEQMQSE